MLEVLLSSKRRIDHGAREHIQSARFQVDHRSGGDTNLRANEAALHVSCSNRCQVPLSAKEIDMPQGRTVGLLRVKGVHAVVLAGNKKNVMLPLAGDLDPGNKQGLRVHRAIHLESAQLSKLAGIHVLWGQDGLVQSAAGRKLSYCEVVICAIAVVVARAPTMEPTADSFIAAPPPF